MNDLSFTNVIYHGDCIKIMDSRIPKDSVDLIFADPPYNLSGNRLKWVNNQTGGDWFMMNERWDHMSDADYKIFTQQWLSKCAELLKNKGSIYVACSYHNIGEIIGTLKRLKFKINNIITWYKTNAMPNMSKRMFTHSTEFVIWGVRNSGWCFNYDKVKQMNPERRKDGEHKQMRDLWQIPLVQGRERLRGENGRALHPTQKPEEMLKRIIIASSNENDIVLDPFLGSGTTTYVASKFGRQWIGIEKNQDYVAVARRRMSEVQQDA